ncbi:MAG: DUF4058 family protein [Pirellulaceae bacterium]|jgi:hypothetical protein|nr:DUF4058 family protein [Pirellulaceae bacterium]
MPLRDHFHPPLSDIASWEEVHGQWPAVIVQQLGKVLPPQYTAGPRVRLGSEVEIDVATFDTQPTAGTFGSPSDEDAAVATAWAPAKPTLAVETQLSDFDEYEVRVYDVRRGRRLVAAIELISPANKDRPEHRSQFTSKCAALLRQGVSLVLVDVVTARDINLYADLLELIGQWDPSLGETPPATYAVACRWRPRGAGRWLESWNQSLKPGLPLPRVPLWLTEDFAIPLDLEASYELTCRDLRIA